MDGENVSRETLEKIPVKIPKMPKNQTDFCKGIKYCRKIKTRLRGQNGRYTGILKNAKGGKYD